MNLLDALNRELDRHLTASDPASARAEIVRMFSALLRGEYICNGCGLRKDSEPQTKGDF